MNIIMNYLNPEILKLYNLNINTLNLKTRNQIYSITKMCYLLSLVCENTANNFDGKLIIPVTYFGEILWMNEFLYEMKPLIELGCVCYSSSGADIEEQIEKKKSEYRDRRDFVEQYSHFDYKSLEGILFLPKTISTAKVITKRWENSIEREDIIWKDIFEDNLLVNSNTTLERMEEQVYNIPRYLDGRAFIYEFVSPLLKVSISNSNKMKLAMSISESYIRSFINEYPSCRIILDLPMASLDCNGKYPRDNTISYLFVYNIFLDLGIIDLLTMSFEALIKLVHNNSFYLRRIMSFITKLYDENKSFNNYGSVISKKTRKKNITDRIKAAFENIENIMEAESKKLSFIQGEIHMSRNIYMGANSQYVESAETVNQNIENASSILKLPLTLTANQEDDLIHFFKVFIESDEAYNLDETCKKSLSEFIDTKKLKKKKSSCWTKIREILSASANATTIVNQISKFIQENGNLVEQWIKDIFSV